MYIRRARRNAAATLAEFLFVIAIGAVLMSATAALWMYSSRSFAGIFSYADLDSESHQALDKISLQIRFHCDEALYGGSGGAKFSVVSWTEL